MKKQITFFFALMLASMLVANNIDVTNIKLTGQDATSDFTLVKFDISWGNSWRTSSVPNNWDAAWVFVKYRVTVANGGDGLWKHAWLNNGGHTAPGGSSINIGLLNPASSFNATTNPGLGAFIYRDADGSGDFGITGVKLRWNYGVNYKSGTTPIDDNDVVDIQVFAIEMVYVPGGAFTVGSGGTEYASFTNGSWTSGATLPLSIASEDILTVSQSNGNLWYTTPGLPTYVGDRAGPIPAAFPKGYAAFYCMKYEMSQQEYVDFLNNLTQTQATARKYNKPTPNYRYEITGSAVGSYSTTNPYVACSFLSWADVAAYLDWSGLRPMTELEFEKACRGTATAVADEYAWGTTTIAPNAGITNPGQNNETSSSNGNCSYDNTVQGPMRVGAFATSSSDRTASGSTYYGIMEMSGNLFERPVTVGTAKGRAFTGTHGDGELDASGNANASTWPGGADPDGSGFRSSGWVSLSTHLRVSERNYAAYFDPDDRRLNDNGGRGVRMAP